MIVNAAAELAPGDEPVARFVEASWSALEAALASALVRARAQGELASDADPVARIAPVTVGKIHAGPPQRLEQGFGRRAHSDEVVEQFRWRVRGREVVVR
jgi:hypothetical protein